MEYQVPQFIEVEDKIFGPFTLKQFIYIAGGAGVVAISFIYLPFIFALLVSLPAAALAGALAFYKMNNKPFIDVVEAWFTYLTGGKLYIWKKEDRVAETAAPAPAAPQIAETREKLKLTPNKLHDLAWSLDVKNESPPPQP